MIVPRFTFLTENFVICCHQVNVPLWAQLYQHAFCKKPLLFSSSSRYHNLGPSESAYIHCACPNPVPLLLATPLFIQEKNWKCLDVQRRVSPSVCWTTSSTKFSLNSCSQSGNSCTRSLCTSSCPSFFFAFLVSAGPCSGFLRNFPLVLPILSVAGFSVYLLTSNTESCDEDTKK